MSKALIPYLKAPETIPENIPIGHTLGIKVLGWASVLGFNAFSLFVLYRYFSNNSNLVLDQLGVLPVSTLTIFSIFILFLALKTLHQKIRITSEGLEIYNFGSLKKKVGWNEIGKIKKNTLLDFLAIKSKNRKTVFFSSTTGFQNLELLMIAVCYKANVFLDKKTEHFIQKHLHGE